MSKYDPLSDYLAVSADEEVLMGFSEIEHILGFDLPPSSRKQRAWWSNNASNNVMTRAWLDAGYETTHVEMAAEKLIFKRVRKPGTTSVKTSAIRTAPSDPDYVKVHPAWGAMQGMLTVPPDLDLTLPADLEWAERLKAWNGKPA